MKTTSRFALAAVAGMLMGGVYAAPAKAADLGGNCCADLEERVAELEATTVRKGTRKVSLTLSGHVNRGIMWYDDGSMTGVRSFDNIMSFSRFRLQGNAKINADWTMGYYQEFEFASAGNNLVSQLDDRGFNSAGGNLQGSSPFNLGVRQSHWFLKNNRLGTVSVGRLNTATKDMPGTDLGGIAVIANSDMTLSMNNFILRPAGTTGREGLALGTAAGGIFPGARVGAFRVQSAADNLRTDGIRYDSPTIMGFTLSTAFGDDYKWDVALRNEGEWNGFRYASAIGYYNDQDEGACDTANAFTLGTTQNGCITGANPIGAAGGFKSGRREQEIFKSNSSIWHMPTGLFVSWAWWNLRYSGTGNFDNQVLAFTNGTPQQRPESDMFWIGAGIKRNWFGIGYTSIFGEYGKIDDPLSGTALNLSTASGAGTNLAVVTDSSVTKWGFGLVQNIDAAATELYLHYMNYSFDVKGCSTAAGAANCGSAANPAGKVALEDISSVQAGARIKF